MDIIFVGDREIKKLNQRWFGEKCSTDVITFGSMDDPFAEIYISVDAARRQAACRGVPVWQELLRLCLHGFAHLEGFGDETPADFCAMREREWALIARAVGN